TPRTSTSTSKPNNASNTEKLNGCDWTAIFIGGNPASVALNVAAATVRGDVTVGTGSGDYRKLIMGGGNSFGYLYGSYPRYGDGIHLGYNYFADAGGTDHVIRTDGPTSRLAVGYGVITLATGVVGAPPTISRLTVTTTTVFVEK